MPTLPRLVADIDQDRAVIGFDSFANLEIAGAFGSRTGAVY